MITAIALAVWITTWMGAVTARAVQAYLRGGKKFLVLQLFLVTACTVSGMAASVCSHHDLFIPETLAELMAIFPTAAGAALCIADFRKKDFHEVFRRMIP